MRRCDLYISKSLEGGFVVDRLKNSSNTACMRTVHLVSGHKRREAGHALEAAKICQDQRQIGLRLMSGGPRLIIGGVRTHEFTSKSAQHCVAPKARFHRGLPELAARHQATQTIQMQTPGDVLERHTIRVRWTRQRKDRRMHARSCVVQGHSKPPDFEK
eukprot:6177263-Pleurochrysis_carterae.AAC.3